MGEWKGPGAGKIGPGLPVRGQLSKDLLPCASQEPSLSSKGCLSMLFTVLASLPSKVYVRVWRFCCCPSESSESLSCPWNPLNSDFGTHPLPHLVGATLRHSPWPFPTATYICCMPGTVLGPWHLCDLVVLLGSSGT